MGSSARPDSVQPQTVSVPPEVHRLSPTRKALLFYTDTDTDRQTDRQTDGQTEKSLKSLLKKYECNKQQQRQTDSKE